MRRDKGAKPPWNPLGTPLESPLEHPWNPLGTPLEHPWKPLGKHGTFGNVLAGSGPSDILSVWFPGNLLSIWCLSGGYWIEEKLPFAIGAYCLNTYLCTPFWRGSSAG